MRLNAVVAVFQRNGIGIDKSPSGVFASDAR
jgi:hypothetical protein